MSKRRLSIFSLMMIIISSILCATYAGSDAYAFSMNYSYSVINKYSSKYNYSFLTEEQKAAYDELEQKFIDNCFYNDDKIHLTSVSITLFDMTNDDAEKIADAFQKDHYYLYWTNTYSYSIGNANIIKISPNTRYNMYSESDIQNQFEAISNVSSEVLKEVSKFSNDSEKAYYIYTWITENAEYAYDENGEPSELPIDHSMYGNIVNKYSVCEGFAEAFTYLCTACGIENSVVIGDSENTKGELVPHAWNIVKIDGKYYYIDTTWDETRTPESYKYAFRSFNDEIFNSNHFPDESYNLPKPEEQSTENLELDKIKKRINSSSYKSIALNLNPSDSKITIYNQGIEVPIENNKFTVMVGAELEFVGTDSRCYSFYKDNVRVNDEIQDGKLTIASNAPYSRVCVTSRKPKLIDIKATYLPTGSVNSNTLWGDADFISESGTINRYVKFQMIVDDATKERADAINNNKLSADYYIRSDVDASMLPGNRVFRMQYTNTEAEKDGYYTGSEIPTLDITRNYVKTYNLVLVNVNGTEVKAYTEEGKRLYNGAKVPYGTRIYLKASSEDGEASNKFIYSDSKIKDKTIDEKGFILLDDTIIKSENSILNISDINYKDEINVNNGTLPNADLLGLSTSAEIMTEDGLKKSFPITWNLSNYDYTNKEPHDVTVNGTIKIEKGYYNLKDGLSTNVEAILHISSPKNLKSIETEIPSKLTVPVGTLRNPYTLGLPIVAEFKNNDGDIIKSQIDWVAEEGNPYNIVGTVKRNGYSYEPIVVKVIEEGEGFSIIPSTSLDYGINNVKTNILTPTASESIITNITIQSINNHKNRVIKVHIPKGFTDAGVANATYLEGINKVNVINNDDETADIIIEVDDNFKDGYLTFDVTMKSIFDSYGHEDTGKQYPSFGDIPLIIKYTAKEDGDVKNVDLAYDHTLQMGGGNEYLANPYYTNYLNLSVPLEKYEDRYSLPIYNFKASKNTSYFEYFQVIYPINENFYSEISSIDWGESAVFDDTTNSIIYTRDNDRVYYSGINYAYNRYDSIRYNLHAKNPEDIKTGMTYKNDKSVYAIGEDFFGNEFLKNFDNKMSLYIYPIDENSNITLNATPYSLVNGYSDNFNFDLTINIDKSTSTVSLKPINDMQVKIEIPDGTTISGLSLPNKVKSIELIYHDDTSLTLTRDDFKQIDYYNIYENFLYEPLSHKSLSTSKKTSSNIYKLDDNITKQNEYGIKEVYIDFNSITDVYNADMEFILTGTNKYPNNKRVDYGNEFSFIDSLDNYKTDCPVADMPVLLKTEYTDIEEKCHTVHLLSDSIYIWNYWGSLDFPYKTNKELKLWGSDDYSIGEIITEGESQPLLTEKTIYDTIISSKTINDTEVFLINKLEVEISDIKLNENSNSVIYITCTDGKTYEYDFNDIIQDGVIYAPEDESIIEYELIIDELVAGKNNEISIYKSFSVDWDKWIEKGYKTGVNYVVSDQNASSYNVIDGSGTCGISVPNNVKSDYSYDKLKDHKNLTIEYDDINAASITAISSLEQLDGCTESYWFIFKDIEKFEDVYYGTNLGVDMPIVFEDVVLSVNTGNNSLVVSDTDMPKMYDKDGNLLATAETVEKTQNSSIYKIHFNNITLRNDDIRYVQYRISPTSDIKPGSYVSSCLISEMNPDNEANKENWTKEYPSDIHTEYKIYPLKRSFDNGWGINGTVNVLTAYSETAVMYGKTAADQDITKTTYNVDADEEFDSVLHIFTGSDSSLSNFETIINIPKDESSITVNGKTFNNTFNCTFVSVLADISITNPHYYYKKNSYTKNTAEDYIEFSGNASEIENPEEITSIKITADSVSNNNEINLRLKAPTTDTKRYSYIYSDINYNNDNNKEIISNVVTYVLGASLEPYTPGEPEDPPLGGEEPKKIATIQIDSSISIIDSCINEEDLNDITFELRKGNGDTEGELIKSIKISDEFEKTESGVYSIKTPIEVELSGDEPEDYYIVESSYEKENTDVKISHNTENTEPSYGNKAAFKLSTNDNAKIIFANEYKAKESEPIDPPLGGEEPKKTAQIQIEKSISIIDECVTEEDLKNIVFELRFGNGDTEGEQISSYSLSEDFNKNEDGTYSIKNPIEVELVGDDPIDYYIIEKSYTVDGKEITINHNLENEEPSTGDKISFKLAADNNLKIFFASEYKSETGPIIDPPLGGETKKTANIFIEQSLNVNDNCIDDEFIKGITYELRLGNGETEGELISTVSLGNDFEKIQDGIYILTNPIVVELSGDEPAEYYIIKTSYTKEDVKTALTHNLENKEPAEGDKISFSLSADDNAKVIFTSDYNLEVPKAQEKTSEEPKTNEGTSEIPTSSQVSPEEPSTENVTSEEPTEEITTEEPTEEITTEESTTEAELGQEIATNESSEPVTEVNEPDNLKKETTVTQNPKQDDNKNIVGTGDNTYIIVLMILMIISLAGTISIIIYKKQK